MAKKAKKIKSVENIDVVHTVVDDFGSPKGYYDHGAETKRNNKALALDQAIRLHGVCTQQYKVEDVVNTAKIFYDFLSGE